MRAEKEILENLADCQKKLTTIFNSLHGGSFAENIPKLIQALPAVMLIQKEIDVLKWVLNEQP